MKQLEKTLKAIANHRRLAIVKLLKEKKELTVGDIATGIKLSFRATSKHLRILSVVDIVENEQRSIKIFYKLSQTQEPFIKYLVSIL